MTRVRLGCGRSGRFRDGTKAANPNIERMPHRFAKCSAVSIVALGLGGCADKAVDIGDGNRPPEKIAPVYASAPPPAKEADAGALPVVQRLVDKETNIAAFTVDTGQLYWLTDDGVPGEVPIRTVNSCTTTNCRSTLAVRPLPVANPYGQFGSGAGIGVNTTQIFWTALTSDYELSFCDRKNCSSIGALSYGGGTTGFIVDDTQLFFGSSITCKIANCEATAARFPATEDAGTSAWGQSYRVLLEGDYLYSLGWNGIVLRTKKDGTGAVETVVTNQGPTDVFAVHGGLVFWADTGVLGRLRACPVTGCVSDPQLVVDGLNRVQQIVADDDFVYITESLGREVTPQSPTGSSRLSRCAVSGCEKPTTLVEEVGLSGNVLVDGDFVYFGGRSCTGTAVENEACSYIGVIRK
jgi:hypothetical protein